MNETDLADAGLNWRYIDSRTQADLTDDPHRETFADEATLFAEDGTAMVVMRRSPAMLTSGGGILPTHWWACHSELLDAPTLARVPHVERIADLDVGLLLDLELESAHQNGDRS